MLKCVAAGFYVRTRTHLGLRGRGACAWFCTPLRAIVEGHLGLKKALPIWVAFIAAVFGPLRPLNVQFDAQLGACFQFFDQLAGSILNPPGYLANRTSNAQKEKSGARRVQPDQVLQGREYFSQEISTRLGNQSRVRISDFDLKKRSSEAPRSIIFWTKWRTVETRAR